MFYSLQSISIHAFVPTVNENYCNKCLYVWKWFRKVICFYLFIFLKPFFYLFIYLFRLLWVLVAARRIFIAARRLLSFGMHAGSSSPTGDQTQPPALGAWSLTHWATREVPGKSFKLSLNWLSSIKIFIFTEFSGVLFCEKWDVPVGGVGVGVCVCVCVCTCTTNANVCKCKPYLWYFFVVALAHWKSYWQSWTRDRSCGAGRVCEPVCGRATEND